MQDKWEQEYDLRSNSIEGLGRTTSRFLGMAQGILRFRAQFRPFHFHPGKIRSRHFIGLVELRSPLVIRTFAMLKVAVDCAPTQAIGFVIADKYMRTPFGWTTLRAMNALTNANILCGRAGYWAGILNSGVSGSQSVMVPISHRSEIW